MDPMQLVAAVSGSVLALLLAWALAPREVGGVGDAEAVRARIAEAHPDFLPGPRAVVGRDGQAAVVVGAEGREFCLVLALGSRPVVWRLRAGALERVEVEPGGAQGETLVLHTGDFTRPRVRLPLPPGASAREWQQTLSPGGPPGAAGAPTPGRALAP
jgi:hypothetical protein